VVSLASCSRHRSDLAAYDSACVLRFRHTDSCFCFCAPEDLALSKNVLELATSDLCIKAPAYQTGEKCQPAPPSGSHMLHNMHLPLGMTLLISKKCCTQSNAESCDKHVSCLHGMCTVGIAAQAGSVFCCCCWGPQLR